jgi:hypothetical protein
LALEPEDRGAHPVRVIARLAVVPLLLTASLAAAAAPAIVPSDPAAWAAIVQKALAAPLTPASPELPAYRGLSDPQGSDAGSHSKEFLNARGTPDASGRFQLSYVELISESWTLGSADGRWHVDQWMFTNAVDGTVTDVTHRTWDEDPDTGVARDIAYDLNGLGDPRIPAALDALVARWAAFTPKP